MFQNSTGNGENTTPSDTGSDTAAFDAFLALETDAEKPSETETKESEADEEVEGSDESNETASADADNEEESSEEPETSDDEDADESSDPASEDDADTEETDDNDTDAETVEVDDEMLVEVKVGDAVQQVSIANLKRLAGQEAALTKKSQAASAIAKQAEVREQFAIDRLTKLKEQAQARVDQYKDVDFVELAASGKYRKEDIDAARAAKKEAEKELAYFDQGLEEFYGKQQEALKERVAEAASTIGDESSPFHIPEFLDKRYAELTTFGTESGIPQEFLDSEPSPWFWKLLDNAQRYATAKTKLSAEPAPKTVKKKGKRVLKSKGSKRTAQKPASVKKAAALKALQANPSSDDAITNAFLNL